MNVNPAAEHLRIQIGLDPQALGWKALSNIVTEHMRVLGMTSLSGYTTHLAQSADELAALIDDVVVPETWFFRGGQVFSFLAEHIRRATAVTDSPAFRILSAPCSSGEEPYSLVIALMEAGVPREKWTVDGIDVSARCLSRAKCGLYRELAFRETPAGLKRKYFRKSEEGWELDPSLRSGVQFRQGNLLDPNLLAGEVAYDLILCRNLLIYLHEEARERVLANLDRLLAPRGVLCMGHAEPWALLDPLFRTTGQRSFFLFERAPKSENITAEAGSFRTARASQRIKRQPPATVCSATMSARLGPPVPTTDEPPFRSLPPVPVDGISKARQEADAGMLDKALESCLAHLSVSEPSAEAFSLLGVIHQARKERKQAADCFRKALYLDPEHEEALLHLLLLYQESGDEAAAELLRRRLDRNAAGGER